MKDISGILGYFLALPLRHSMTLEKSFASTFKCTKAAYSVGEGLVELLLPDMTRVAIGKGEERSKSNF